jgi:hypothetical protein
MEEIIRFLDNGPDWRWSQVRSLVVEKRDPGRAVRDSHVRDGWRFFKRWRKSTEADLPYLKQDYPHLTSAYILYANPQSERWIIEAGLLTDVSHEELSEYVGHHVEVIRTYEKYFYDVRPKLGSRGYILNQILIPAVTNGIHERDYDFLYKTLAYCGGWKVFCEFIDNRNMSEDSYAFLQNNFKDRMLKLGWITAHKVQPNNFNSGALLDACLKLKEIEQKNESPAQKDEMMTQLNHLLDHCKTTIISARAELIVDEPRASELMGGAVLPRYQAPVPELTGGGGS